MKIKANNLIAIFTILSIVSLQARHPFRRPNTDFPLISAQWQDEDAAYSMRSPYVRLHPLFTIKTEDLFQYRLPKDGISLGAEKLDNKTINYLVEKVLSEIKSRKKNIKKDKQLEHFKVLQDKNFNYKKCCGLIVLKFKNYPLVLKLFMEQPSSILQFRSTGFEPTFFFYMGGGANRHLSGFTRPKNREILLQKAKTFERWADYISCPRKWVWLPHNQRDIILTGKNIAGYETIQTHIPSIYGIIADEVPVKEATDQIPHKVRSRIIMQLCNDLEMYVDPHEKNFVFLKDERRDRFKIVILDTEHFPTMVGILRRKKFRNHTQWYTYLASKCFHDMYMQSKRHLLSQQDKISELALM